MEQAATFRFSDEGRMEAKQRILLWQVFLPVMLALLIFLSPLMGSNFLNKLIAFIIVLIFIEALIIIVSAITFEKMKELTLTLSGESIERTAGKLTEKINYADIRRIDINERPSGKIAYINGLVQHFQKETAK